MFAWISKPFIRFLFFFLAGKLLSEIIDPVLPILLITLFIYFLGLFFLKPARLWVWKGMGFLGLLVLFLLGAYQSSIPSYFSQPQDRIQTDAYVIWLNTDLQVKNDYAHTVGLLLRYHDQGQWKQGSHKIQLRIETKADLKYGSILLIKSKPNEVSIAGNPGGFNYGQWQKSNHIHYQDKVTDQQMVLLGNESGNPVVAFSYKIRNHVKELFKEKIEDPKVIGVLQALVLGFKADLDSEVRSAYSGTGAMHVLAVSGLHVGIIYMGIVTIFGFLRKKKNGSLLFVIIALVQLSLYAMITGLSASVLRATLMFSIIVIAQSLRRSSNIYNNIAASAFLLLLFDPGLLGSISFQLSYLAVTGIVYFYPRIYGLWKLKNWFLDKLWSLSSVSIAAQLSTFPIIIFYFKQFPVYGLLSNLIVVPGATMIVYGAALMIILLSVSDVFGWVPMVLEKLVWGMNQGVFIINSLPFSILEVPGISQLQLFILYGLLLSLVVLFRRPSFLKILMPMLLVMGFSGSVIDQDLRSNSRDHLVIFNAWPHTMLGYFSNENILVYRSADMKPSKISRLLEESKDHFGVSGSQETDILSDSSIQFLQVNSRTVAVINKVHDLKLDSIKLRVDILLLRRNSLYRARKILKHFEYDTLIVDGSCSKYANKGTIGLPEAYWIPEQGAFVLEIK